MHRSLTLLALAALTFTGLNALRRKHYERLADTPRAKPEALQTWEGEGGGLPSGAPGQSVYPTSPRRDSGVDSSADDSGTRDAF
jgi:hypothetical protein